MYGSIVVGTDGSDTAKRAVAEATQLAKLSGARIHLVSAFEPLRGAKIVGAPEGAAAVWAVQPDQEVNSVVNEAIARIKLEGVEVKPHAVTGDPADALLQIAESEKADVIVVGNRGMHGMRSVLGSVPNKVSHRAKCHVFIVATGAD